MSNKKKVSNIFKGDKVIWMIFLLLCMISLVEVFSASSQLSYRTGAYWGPFFKHVGLLAFGFVCMLITLNIQCRYFKIVTPFLIILSLILLLWVDFAGSSTNGANRWIQILGLQFQPSEIAKGTMVLVTAQILSAMQTDRGADKKAFKWIVSIAFLATVLIGFENLSTAALLDVVIFFMMFVGRVPWSQLGKLMGLGVASIAIVIILVLTIGKDNQTTVPAAKASTEQIAVTPTEQRHGLLHRFDTWKNRLDKFINHKDVAPDSIDLDKDAQVTYAHVAIASSNVIGKGPGNSDVTDFLSQAFSDFIYSIIIEETGIEGAAIVAFLYIFLLFRTSTIASRCENSFPAFLAMGLALMLVTQAIFNMGVAVGIFPVTGQPLPLISKGGTSTIINCIYMGAILSVSRTAKKRKGMQASDLGKPTVLNYNTAGAVSVVPAKQDGL